MPNWVYDLITAVEEYEELHDARGGGSPCLNSALAAVPFNERAKAQAIAEYVRQQADADKQAG